MRLVMFGAGAIGGVVGARLHQSGYEVSLVARGAHLEAIRHQGLVLESPAGRETLSLPAAEDPAELDVGRPGDVVLLAVKSQDTLGALEALRRAGASAVPVVCLQNGVENERVALRRHRLVYGAVVMLPAAHLEPGAVQAYGARLTGIIDVGCYPSGSDELCRELSDALSDSNFLSRVRDDVMTSKYAKLVLNLGNAVGALCGTGEASQALTERAREEGRAALRAAGIGFEAPEVTDLDGRWQRIDVQAIGDKPRAGSSSWQSLARGTGAIETDYLNGEIVLLGRLHGVRTPVNAALTELAAARAREGAPPGDLSPDDVLSAAA